MAERVEIEFRRHGANLIGDGSTLVLAYSGGSDSTALLHLFDRIARRRRLTLVVAHLDHALRPDSADDRDHAERLAAALGHEVITDRRDVQAARRKRESLEEAARRVRRGFLMEVAAAHDATVATGHTRDDQAETILMRLARGTGPRGLGGMAERGPGPFVRPLLFAERRALREWLTRRGHTWLEDPTNEDERFDRNRTRRRVVPILERELNPRAVDHLVAAARRVRADADWLDTRAAEELESLMRVGRDASVVAPGAALARLPGPLGRRAVAGMAHAAGIDPRRLTERHIETLLDLASGGRGRQADLPGLTARKDARGALRIARRSTADGRGGSAPPSGTTSDDEG